MNKCRWKADPLLAGALLWAGLGMDQAFIDATWHAYPYRRALSQALVGTRQGEARWALRAGHVPAGSKVANGLLLLEPSPLRKALPAAVSLVK